MLSPLRRPWTAALCLLALVPLTLTAHAQNSNVDVTTWHNDPGRTGWQAFETKLTATGVTKVTQANFGLLWKWGPLDGNVYAQPLAKSNVAATNCLGCDLIFIATEKDKLYAFNAASSSQTPVWSPLDLAGQVGGSAVDCSVNLTYPLCIPPKVLGSYVGVTGTPVIDGNTLYVVAAVQVPGDGSGTGPIVYYLFAVDIRTGTVTAHTTISGTVPGHPPQANVRRRPALAH